jgi:[ribosomal protein S18]-alanine N-acetyltransferase
MMGGDTETGRNSPDDMTAGQVSIAPARFRDLWKLRRLQRRSFRRGLAYSIGTLVLLWALPSTPFFAAHQGGEVLGCAIGDRNSGLSRVINICVDPDARRRGIGERLLQALEAALSQGDMLLMVEEGNDPARRLYEKLGYASTGVAYNYYGKGQNGVWMRKQRGDSDGVSRIFV